MVLTRVELDVSKVVAAAESTAGIQPRAACALLTLHRDAVEVDVP